MEPRLPGDPLIDDAHRSGRRRLAAARSRTATLPDDRARHEARTGLYVHVPFCARRCSYCDFSTGALSSRAVDRYLEALRVEVAQRSGAVSSMVFTSVFFGGGTPSALSARHFREVHRLLRDHFAIDPEAEFTLEANPESVRPALLDAWREAGVNRLSMGAQSFDPGELTMLGRIHSADRPAEAFALARAHGFRRLSLDLMFGYPGHTRRTWTHTLERALELGPEHLSAYCFIPEPGTPLGDAVAAGTSELPDADEQADLHAMLAERLERAGLACYETSNFCRPDAEARHNLVYWLRRPYVGLGPSAHGFLGGVRYGNHHALARWAQALECREPAESELEPESGDSIALEVMMLGLRLAGGIRERDYDAATWRAVEHRYGAAFRGAMAAGRLERASGGVRIPAHHRFVADDVIAWIEAFAARPQFDRSGARFITSNPCHNPQSPAV
jgi:oxygen-independent coproporphyrinogen-3 oxidase